MEHDEQGEILNLTIKAVNGMINIDTVGDRDADNAFSFATLGNNHSGIQCNTEDKRERSNLSAMTKLMTLSVERYLNRHAEKEHFATASDVDVFDLMDGKYTFILNNNGSQEVLRYGEPWQKKELIGNNLTMAMAYEIISLKEEVKQLKADREQQEDMQSPRY